MLNTTIKPFLYQVLPQWQNSEMFEKGRDRKKVILFDEYMKSQNSQSIKFYLQSSM